MTPTRDWMLERAFIAHYFPGVGEPNNLTLTEWNGILLNIGEVLGTKSGNSDHDHVEREMRTIYGEHR